MSTGRRVAVWIGVTVAVVLLGVVAYGVGSAVTNLPVSSQISLVSSGSSSEVSPYADSSRQSAAPSGGAKGSSADMAVTQESYALKASSPGAGESASLISAPEKMIIKNAMLDLRVDKLDTAIEKLRQTVASVGGEIQDLSVSAGVDQGPIPYSEAGVAYTGPANAVATIRVPAEKLDALTASLAKLGKVISRSENAQDVTEQAIDVEARLKTLRAEEARLRDFLNRTNKVSDLLQVERELSRVRGEIESMQAQLTYLQRQSAKATLTVTMSEPGPVVSPQGPTWGIREAVTKGIRGAAAILAGMIVIAIALAPFALVIAVLWLIVRAIRKRRHPAETPPPSDNPQE